ncbi:MAG: hypothetical protein HKP12_12335 [Gammaproteobacteria bacterium]|nr:hypothetical protein [Gammaproteobacteria bacterium]
MQACSRHRNFIFIVLITIPISQSVLAQNVGQSKKIQHGIVTASKEVDLSSNAVPKGALIGGGIGLLSTRRGPSRQNRTRNVVVGTAAGAAIGAASSSGDTGILYDVKTGTGVVQVVTDQTEIRVDDCVAVEQSGDTANLRRVSADHCTQANAAAVAPAADESGQANKGCIAAKQELVEAKTKEQADLATTKIKTLCDE